MLFSRTRQFMRIKLQDRYGISRATQEVNQFSEQMAYGHREVLIRYLDLPQTAYFRAIMPHGKILPQALDPIKPEISREGRPLLQALWRSDAEEIAHTIKNTNVISIGATGLYEFSNLGLGIHQVLGNVESVSERLEWSENTQDLLDKFSGKRVLYMPTHSWDGDVVEHSLDKVDFLKKLDVNNVRVSLGYLDFADPTIRRVYSQTGWKIECAGARASKVFGSPAGGRVTFLTELFHILDWAEIVIADELTTGQMYAAGMGKEIGLLPENDSVALSYSKWQTNSDLKNLHKEVRDLYPWLTGKSQNSQKMKMDICQALGIDKFKTREELASILPWYEEEKLSQIDVG